MDKKFEKFAYEINTKFAEKQRQIGELKAELNGLKQSMVKKEEIASLQKRIEEKANTGLMNEGLKRRMTNMEKEIVELKAENAKYAELLNEELNRVKRRTTIMEKEMKILEKIEYYFLEYNLQKNFILQSKMDENGFLPLDLIASFPRIRSLTIDQDFIIDSLRDSEKIELSEDQQKVRLRMNPLQWPPHYESGIIGDEEAKQTTDEVRQQQNVCDGNEEVGKEFTNKMEEEGEQTIESVDEHCDYDGQLKEVNGKKKRKEPSSRLVTKFGNIFHRKPRGN